MPVRAAVAAAMLAMLAAAPAPATGGVTLARAEQEIFFTITPDRIEIVYVTTFNRPAAFIEQMHMDADGDGLASGDEQRRYFSALARNLSSGLDLSINGKQVLLVPTGAPDLDVLNDKRLFEKIYRFTVPHPAGWEDGAVVEFHNDNYLDFAGEIIVQVDPRPEVDVVYDSRWETRQEEAVTTPPADRDVTFRYRRGTGKWQRPPGFTPGLGPTHPGVVDDSSADEPSRAGLISIGVWPVLVCAAWIVVGLICGANWKPVIAGGAAILIGGVCIAGFLLNGPRAGGPPVEAPPEIAAQQIFQKLHRNIYRAFDAKTESDIYDTLARGLTGEILDDVYNEVYQSYLSRNNGGGRFSVRRVKPITTTVLPGDHAGAYRIRYRWRVYGTVTHAGHTHARANEYEAVYLVRHTGVAWRIAGSHVRQNKRVTVGQS